LNESRKKRRIRGAILLPGRAVISSADHRTEEHATLVVTVVVGLEGPLRLTSAGREIARGPVLVVPPRMGHTSLGGGAALSFFYAPTSFPGAVELARLARAGAHGSSCAVAGRLGAWMAGAVRSQRARVGDTDVLAGLSDELASAFPAITARAEDARVHALLGALGLPGSVGVGQEEPAPLDFRDIISRAARRCSITSAHLSALFVRDVGLQLRTYQRWLRLSHGLELMGKFDVTTAAHLAGFSDLPHFSRTCRGSFGVSPGRWIRELIR
jgi:AraC-like DNA-binding protein